MKIEKLDRRRKRLRGHRCKRRVIVSDKEKDESIRSGEDICLGEGLIQEKPLESVGVVETSNKSNCCKKKRPVSISTEGIKYTQTLNNLLRIWF